MNKYSLLILGARSDIAMAVAYRFAKDGYDIQLASRDVKSLDANKFDIELRYQVAVSLHEFDVLDIGSHDRFVVALPKLPSVVACAVGYMGIQADNVQNVQLAAHVMRSNYEGPASIISVLANKFEERGFGTIVGISSVAGERGRAKNYVYGSAKAGLTAFLSGLRNRLDKKGVHVLTVLPGFVATKMTENLNLPSKLTAQPDEIANDIYEACRFKKDVIYHKRIWRLIMVIVRNIPERLFKQMNI